MRAILISVVALAVVPVDGVAKEGPTCSPGKLDTVLSCLGKRAGGPARVISPKDAPPSIRVVRAGSAQGHWIYVVAGADEQWSVIDELYYEQQHGKRESSFELASVTEQAVGDTKVLRVDYRTDSDTNAGDTETTEKREETALCAPSRRPGCLRVSTKCEMKRDGDEAESDAYSAKLVVSRAGEVSLAFESRGSGKLCKPPIAPLKLW